MASRPSKSPASSFLEELQGLLPLLAPQVGRHRQAQLLRVRIWVLEAQGLLPLLATHLHEARAGDDLSYYSYYIGSKRPAFGRRRRSERPEKRSTA